MNLCQQMHIDEYKREARHCALVWFDVPAGCDPQVIMENTLLDSESNGGVKDYHFELIK